MDLDFDLIWLDSGLIWIWLDLDLDLVGFGWISVGFGLVSGRLGL